MKFDKDYMREVKKQLKDLKDYLVELQETVNPNFEYIEYQQIAAAYKASEMLEIGLGLID